MKNNIRYIILLLFVLFLSGCQKQEKIETETTGPAVPWTKLETGNRSGGLRFVITADRTGSERQGVFAKTVDKINLLQPEFVLCVGDLIEGYSTDSDLVNKQWDEFDELVDKLDMPFFYVPGNHDITNTTMAEIWEKRYGKTYYHFLYKNVLFLCMNSESHILSGGSKETINPEQIEYFREVLNKHLDVKWTFVFLHKPLWDLKNKGWMEFEEMMAGRKHTVFGGHKHKYKKLEKNNSSYILLSTSGGSNGMRGISYGEFDHVTQVVLQEDGPVIANLMINGIFDENISTGKMGNLMDLRPFKVDPVFVNTKIFTGSKTAVIRLQNDGDAVLEVTGEVQPHKNIKVKNSKITEKVPANSEKIILLEMICRSPVNVESADPLVINWSLKSKLSNNPDFAREAKNEIKLLWELSCKNRRAPVKIDGDLNEWSSFPNKVNRPEQIRFDKGCYSGSRDGKYEFAVEKDDKNLYMAVKVKDDIQYLDKTKPVWRQDGIEVRIDAREAGLRNYSKSITEFYDILFVALSPSATGKGNDMVFYNKDALPAGVKAICVNTNYGFNTEIAVPLSYFEEKQGMDWSAFRLNICVDDFDSSIEQGTQLWWKPDWRTAESYSGSGTFFRDEK